MFIKSKGDLLTESDLANRSYDVLSQKFGYTSRISKFWEMLSTTFGLSKFEIMDYSDFRFGMFENYLLDKFTEWSNGKDIDFSEISGRIMEVGDFTVSEKLLLSSEPESLEERVWSIFEVISFPERSLLINK